MKKITVKIPVILAVQIAEPTEQEAKAAAEELLNNVRSAEIQIGDGAILIGSVQSLAGFIERPLN